MGFQVGIDSLSLSLQQKKSVAILVDSTMVLGGRLEKSAASTMVLGGRLEKSTASTMVWGGRLEAV